MNATGRLRWLRAVVVVAVGYVAVGITFAALANRAASSQTRMAWRLAAWVISAGVFAAHIGNECVRLRSTPRTAAFRASSAVALGAFALAIAALAHGQATASPRPFPVVALIIWPVLTGLPAYVVGLVTATALRRARRTGGAE